MFGLDMDELEFCKLRNVFSSIFQVYLLACRKNGSDTAFEFACPSEISQWVAICQAWSYGVSCLATQGDAGRDPCVQELSLSDRKSVV